MTIPDPNVMPQWAMIRYSEAVRRATTNARKPWRHVFSWDEVNSFAWETAIDIWQTWEASHIRLPERYANRDLTLRTANRLDAEARKLGWSRKQQPDGSWKWIAPPVKFTNLLDSDGATLGADSFITQEPISRQELQDHLLVLARNYHHLNAEAERLSEPVWEQFSAWVARY